MEKGNFGMIRKAIEGSAETKAENDNLEKPTAEHFEYVFDLYKKIRDMDPEMAKELITLAAEGKELRDELGSILYKPFKTVWDELDAKYKGKVMTEIRHIDGKDLEPEEYKTEVKNIITQAYKEIRDEVEKDTRIISAFSGKETLLKKALEFTTTGALRLL